MMFAPPKLTVSGVFAKLREIATMSGSAVRLTVCSHHEWQCCKTIAHVLARTWENFKVVFLFQSMSKKVEIIKSMFVACQQSEARYLIRWGSHYVTITSLCIT